MINLSQRESEALLKSVRRNGSHSGEVYVIYRRPSSKIFISYSKHNILSKTGCHQNEVASFQLKSSDGSYEKTLHYFLETDNTQNYAPKLVITSSSKDFEVRNLFSVSDFQFNDTVLGNFYEVGSDFVLNKLMTINKFTEKSKHGDNLKYRAIFKLKKASHLQRIQEFFKSIKIKSEPFCYTSSLVSDGKIVTIDENKTIEDVVSYSIEPRSGVSLKFLRSKNYKVDGVVEIVVKQPQTIQNAINDFFEILGQPEVVIKSKKPNLGMNEYAGFKPNGYLFMNQPYAFMRDLLRKDDLKNGMVYEFYYYLLNGLLDTEQSIESEDDFFSHIRGGDYYVKQAVDPYQEIAKYASNAKNKGDEFVFYVFDNNFLRSNATTQSFDGEEFVLKNVIDLSSFRYACIVSFEDRIFSKLGVPNVTLVVDPRDGKIIKVVENLNIDLNMSNLNKGNEAIKNLKEVAYEHKTQINNDSGTANHLMASTDSVLSE